MTAQNNLIPNEFELKDVLELFRKELFLNLNCHAIAKIQTFNPLNQTAVASVNYQKTFYEENFAGILAPKFVPYPFLVDCPVICLGGGNGCLTFPINTGDDCLVMFNDRDLDNWFKGSTTSGVNTARLHSFADGILIVGLRSMSNVIPTYSSDSVELRTLDGLTKISIASDGSKVTIKVGPTMTMEIDNTGKFKLLNALGEDLITALVNLFTQSTVLGIPLVTPPTDLAVLQSFMP